MEMSGGIEVRITGATPLEVLARITAWGLRCSSEPSVYRMAKQLMDLENGLNAYPKESAAPAESPADPPGPAAGATGPSAAPSEKSEKTVDPPAPAPEKHQETRAPKPTSGKAPSLEDIRAKGIAAAEKYGKPAVKAILTELGAEGMTTLPEDKRATFLEKLEGLGENNA